MKKILTTLALVASSAVSGLAATINWSAGIDAGFSLLDGTNVPVGALLRLGYFRDAGTGLQLTDVQIQAQASTPTLLEANFVEVGTTTMGSGFTPAVAGHFSASSTADTGTGGLNLAGKQMYLWVFDAATTGAATQQAILYWDVTNIVTNPDGGSAPGPRWSFPGQDPVPGSTNIDLTDLTTGTGSLASGAHLLVGSYPSGTSVSTGANTFALALIASPLAISTSGALTGGVKDVAYSKALVATGGVAPYTWTAVDTLPNGITLGTDGLLSGTPTLAADFSFTVKVTDNASTFVSRLFALHVAGTAPSITSTSPLPEGTVGTAYNQTLSATGGTAPYTWTVSVGALPSPLVMSGGGVITGTPTTASTTNLTLQITDAHGLTATQAVSLTVVVTPVLITTSSPLNAGVLGIAFSQTFAATGGTSPYTWLVTAGAVPGGLNLSSGGVLSGTPTTTVGSPFGFTLQATDSANPSHVVTKAFTLVINSSLVVPVVNPPTFPTTIVSGTFNQTLTAANYPKTFSATGLPTGLTLTAATGVISGRPTVSGVFMVQIKATNAKGTSPVVTAKLVVQALPTGAVGTFVGTVARSQSVNGNLGARFDMTTTATGTVTGKIIKGVTIQNFTGNLAAVVGGNPQVTLTAGGLPLVLTLNAATNTLSGFHSTAAVTAWRKVWNATTNPASAQVGYYTAGLDLTDNFGVATVPQGTGYMSFTIALDGSLTVSGKTSDNSTIATAGFIGPNGQIAVYTSLYGNLGSVHGQLALATDAADSFEDNTVTGSPTWMKPTTIGRQYPAAFGPLTLGAYGKYLARASTGSIVLGLPDTATPMALEFNGGGISLSAIPSADVTGIFYKGVTTVVMPATNPAKATLSINAVNGVVGGTFKLVDPAPTLTRTVTYYGMIIRPQSGTAKAFGFFLMNQIPLVGQTIANSPTLSGQMVIMQ